MKRLHMAKPVVAALAAMLTIAAALGVVPGAGAQRDTDTYTFPLSGAEVAVRQPWKLDAGATVETADANVVKLDGPESNILLGVFPAGTPVEEADAAMVGPYGNAFGDVRVVEAGETAAYAYALSVAVIDGEEHGVFSLYSPERPGGFAEAAIFIGPLSGFGQALDEAKQAVSVDGAPVFSGVEGTGLQQALPEPGRGMEENGAAGPPLPSAGLATPAASPAARPED